MIKNRPLTDWLMLFVLVVTWGSAFMLMKITLTSMPPMILAAVRLSIAAMVLLTVTAYQGHSLRLLWAQWRFLIVLAIIGSCIPFFLISWGQQNIDSSLAGILMAVIPLLTLLMSHFAHASERITLSKLSGFVLGFAGIIVLVGPEALRNIGSASFVAQLAVLGGACCYAINVVITPFNRVSNSMVTAATTLLLAAIIMLPLALWQHPLETLTISRDSTLAVIVLGILGTALPQLIFYRLVASAGPTFYSQINYMIPLWAVLIGALFLDERPDWNAYAALALILGGIGVSQLTTRTA